MNQGALNARIAACLVVVAALVFGVARGAAGDTVPVPASIPADCSRNVAPDLNAWLASIPDGATAQFVAGGCYSEDSTINLTARDNLTIDGNGATFKRLTPSNESQNPPPPNSDNAMWRVDRGSGDRLENMTIVGNYQPAPHGTPGQGQYTDHGIWVTGAAGLTVTDVTISHVDGEGITADPDVATACALYGCDYSKAPPSRGIVYDRVSVDGAGRQCASATDVDGLTVADATFNDCQQTGLDLEIDVPGELMRDVTIRDVTVTDAYFAPFSLPVLAFPGYEGTVRDITFTHDSDPSHDETCYPALWIGSHTDTTATGLAVTDNHFATVGDGIRFTAAAVEATVSGNTITFENPGNTGCYNPDLSPPYSMPVRAAGLSGVAVDATNTFQGFCCGQDQQGQLPPTTTTVATTTTTVATTTTSMVPPTTTVPTTTTVTSTTTTTTVAPPTTIPATTSTTAHHRKPRRPPRRRPPDG